MSEENLLNDAIPPEPDGEVDDLLDELVEEETTETDTDEAVVDESVEARLRRAYVILYNASGGNPAIADALVVFGFDAARFDDGWALYNTAKELSDIQKVRYAARIGAYSRFDMNLETMVSAYRKYLRIARNLYEGDAGVTELLELTGDRERRTAKFIEQMRRFFANALKAEIVGTFTENGITEQVLNQWLTKATEVDTLYAVYRDARSIAQSATLARNDALFELESWLRRLLVFAQAALEDDTQLLESLMVLVRTPKVSSKDRQKKVPQYPVPPFELPPMGVIVP